ncbi:MAG: 1-acyl-sn-glycerol-3-phosphate acyltransferase [Deltaproteobacteria bacterium]|nr:1-acyl-sn-glycerol-3-phosphate acyltransferase [Deltaproteobacteria bacterium]
MGKSRADYGRIRQKLDRFLQHTHDHFACYLPPSLGAFFTWLLGVIFSGAEINKEDKETLRSLAKDHTLVYATKYKSPFEFLFFYFRFKREGLPYPQLGLDQRILLFQPITRFLRIVAAHIDQFITFKKWPNPYESGYIQKQVLSGTVSMVSMVDKRAFYRRYVKARVDPLLHLLDVQTRSEKDILIVPQLTLYGTKPQKRKIGVMGSVFGTEERPGRLRRLLSLVKIPEKAVVEMVEPINLREFMESYADKKPSLQYLAYELRQEIVDRINRHRQSIVGPELINRDELRQRVLQSENFREYVKELALSSERSVYEFHAEAAAYLDEIAAKYSSFTIAVLDVIVRWLTDTMFDGVEVDTAGLKRLKDISKKGPVILIPCHKSHIDYLILSYVLYTNRMPCPLIAAGKNLSFFPLGPVFRNAGAFFIRRTFKGLPLYSKVFSEYIYALLEAGFNLEFFIEGGRSRTGKLVMPKFGLLSIILDAYARGAAKDLYFQPIYIGYDRVVEEGAYIKELEGQEKTAENFSQVVRARKFLKKRFGRIFLEFNEPIRAGDVMNNFEVPYDKMSRREKEIVYRNLAHRIIHAIDEVSVATPHGLVAAAALTMTSRSRSFSEQDLLDKVEFYLTHLKMKGAKYSDTLSDPPAAVRQALDAYVRDKFLVRYEEKPEEPETQGRIRYAVVQARRPLLEYYKNNCIGHFIPEAYTALSILTQEAFEFSADQLHTSYQALMDLFKNEFHYDPDLSAEYYVRKSLKSFINDAMVTPHPTIPDRYNITAAGHKKMATLASLLKNFFESYLVVLRVFARENLSATGRKERYKKFLAQGTSMFKSGEIELKESLSKVNFENAASYFMSRGIHGPSDAPDIELYEEVIQNFRNCIP